MVLRKDGLYLINFNDEEVEARLVESPMQGKGFKPFVKMEITKNVEDIVEEVVEYERHDSDEEELKFESKQLRDYDFLRNEDA
jgi:hypothetical protein